MTTAASTEIHITTELARSVGDIAGRHSGSIRISYNEADPENIWHVEVDEGTHNVSYIVNDESGVIVSSLAIEDINSLTTPREFRLVTKRLRTWVLLMGALIAAVAAIVAISLVTLV